MIHTEGAVEEYFSVLEVYQVVGFDMDHLEVANVDTVLNSEVSEQLCV